jgi:hypothetical protein
VGYGYIEAVLGNSSLVNKEIFRVDSFKEKPSLEVAQAFVAKNNFYWNSGIFIWNVSTIVNAFRIYQSPIASVFESLVPYYYTDDEQRLVNERFPECRSISVDYAIMERADEIFVFPADFGWSDLGTWMSLHCNAPKDVNGNAALNGKTNFVESKNCVVNTRGLKNVVVIGMHIHIGSQIRELHVFENMCNKVNAIVENLTKLGFDIEFVDVGGGLGINYDMPENEPIPNFASVFAIIKQHLKVGNREVHFEFGRSIVGQCGELITKVLYNKTTATGRRLVIVDSSMTELIRPALYGSYHNIENITSQAEQRTKYTIVGTACESTDIFDENVSLPLTKRGDLLTIKSAGAYGMSMASRYNQHDLPAAVYSDEL